LHISSRRRGQWGGNELVVVVGYKTAQIAEWFSDAFDGVPITYAYQCKGEGPSYAVLQIKPHADQMFLLYNGDNVFADDVQPMVGAVADADTVLGVANVLLTGTETTSILIDKMECVVGVVEKPAVLPSH